MPARTARAPDLRAGRRFTEHHLGAARDPEDVAESQLDFGQNQAG